MPHWVTATTLPDLLDRRALERGADEALVFPDERVTYAGLAARAEALSRALLGLGVQRYDRVGLLLPASVDLVALLFAVTKVGAVAVPVNARFRSHELGQLVRHSGMAVLFVHPVAAPDVADVLGAALPGLASAATRPLELAEAPELRHVVRLGPGAAAGMLGEPELTHLGETVPAQAVARRQEGVRVRDTAVLVYTSGTTAAPKGAMISHEALTRLAHGIADVRMPLSPSDRVWTAIPLFHGGGITFALSCVQAGCAFVHPGFFSPDTTLSYLVRERVTVALAAFETIWLPVLEQPDFTAHDLSRIRLVMAVGVPERLRAMAAELPDALHISCVAMTESSAFLSLGSADDSLDNRTSTGGRPMPGMECRVVDEGGREQPAGVGGELLFRGPSAFDGYFRDAEQTAQVFDADGWFHTGDVVTADEEGRLTFVSRIKDMLKVGGENVAAAEVEGFLLGHPAVKFVQVVAAPDTFYVEVPAAFIELRPGARLSEQEVVDYCLGSIATFRVPRYVRFVDEWPMSGTKIQKFVLRQRIAAELAALGIARAPRLRAPAAPR